MNSTRFEMTNFAFWESPAVIYSDVTGYRWTLMIVLLVKKLKLVFVSAFKPQSSLFYGSHNDRITVMIT